MDKKLISIVVPVHNEQDNIRLLYDRITKVMLQYENYEYEIVFFEDGSTDNSRKIIEEICACDDKVSAVIFSRNFGYSKNIFYSVQQSKGDAVMLIHADMQNPPEEIPRFIKEWEQGSQVVIGVKNKSRENKFMFFWRTLFYKVMNMFFGVNLVPHATDFGLFDKSFVDILKQVKTNRPFLRGLILQYAKNPKYISYVQDKRNAGKSWFNVSKYYSFAIDGIVGYSKILPRRLILASVIGVIVTLLEYFIFCLPRMIKTGRYLTFSNSTFIHLAVIMLFVVLAAVSIFAEYAIAANDNSETKPLIVEEKRINY